MHSRAIGNLAGKRCQMYSRHLQGFSQIVESRHGSTGCHSVDSSIGLSRTSDEMTVRGKQT